MTTVLITGGTGFVGRELSKLLLANGYGVIILSRKPEKKKPVSSKISYARWNTDDQTIDITALSKADYIVHLAGAGIADKRWTKERKAEIINSRIKSSQLIINSLKKAPNNIKAVISCSAIGWYGCDPTIPNIKPFSETDPPQNDFLGTTCRLWEESIEPVTQLGKRLVKLRTGIVLSRYEGFLKRIERPMKFGIAAILGSGKKIVSWIHLKDLAGIFLAAIENENMHGVYNAVSPHPVSGKELVIQLAKSRKNFYIPFHIPSFILKLLFGKISDELLKSATVSSGKIAEAGFSFQFPRIKEAMENG